MGAQQLHYWLLLPNDVKPVNLVETTIEGLSMYCIGEYASVDEDKSRMEVAVCYEHCKYEMNAADWLVKKLDNGRRGGQVQESLRKVDGCLC